MFLFDIFRSFLPLQNPIGFGAADYIELVLALLLVGFALAWNRRVEGVARRFAEKLGWCMLALAVLPVALRLLLLAHYPVPTPSVSDDFSYLLLADTLRHLRLANPPHPLSQFFETFFVLQQPTYSSIFPLGQGIALAIGWTLFGHPWAGVALSIAALCPLCYWMLRGWTTPAWALAGGLLAAIQFGPLNQWMNSYWGGAVSAAAGCLTFGSLPRLRDTGRTRYAVLLGLGLALQLLTRPYESVFLDLSVILYFLPALPNRGLRRRLVKAAGIAALVVAPAIGLTLLQNKQVTGSWTTLPYMLSRYQHGVPITFTVQPNPTPHLPLTREQQLDYEVQSAVHGPHTDTLREYLGRLASRVRFYRFFFLAPLYLALPLFLLRIREYRFAWVAMTLLIFALGTNFYPYFYSHYIAAETCLFLLVAVAALERLAAVCVRGRPTGRDAATVILFLCAAHFVFWYGIHLFPSDKITPAMTEYETWDAVSHPDPDGRDTVLNQISRMPGDHLVFVRYWPQHTFEEWVHNGADIDHARIVWARDLGAAENEKLQRYFPTRTVWLLEPDASPPRLTLIARGAAR